jgi:RHS repeat-associated protein
MLRIIFSFLAFLLVAEGAWAQLPTIKEIKTDAIIKFKSSNSSELLDSPEDVAEKELQKAIANFVPNGCKSVSLYRLRPWDPESTVNGVARVHEYAFWCVHVFGPAYDNIVRSGNIDVNVSCPESKDFLYGWQLDGSNTNKAWIRWCKNYIAVPTRAESDGFSCTRQDGDRFGGPIIGSTGQKIREEDDFIDGGPHGLSIVRTFLSPSKADVYQPFPPFGGYWFDNIGARIKIYNKHVAGVSLGGGEQKIFIRDVVMGGASSWRPLSNEFESLEVVSDGYVYFDPLTGTGHKFNQKGNIVQRVERNGWVKRFGYDAADRLVNVVNNFGRSLALTYSGNLVAAIVLPDGGRISYAYDESGFLKSVSYPDGSHRAYYYEDGRHAGFLTGIDLNGDRYSSYSYDAVGRGVSTQLAGGVESYKINFSDPAPRKSISVLDPLGKRRTYNYVGKNGHVSVVGISDPSELSDIQTRRLNDYGLVEAEVDFKGAVTQYTWNAERRLPLTIQEAVGTAEQRITSVDWHPKWGLPVKVTQVGRITTYLYDEAGNVTSRTVSNTSGSENFTTRWDYNSQGLVASETAHNGAVTRYTYDSSGNLIRSVNPLGHADSYQYDQNGRITVHVSPTGFVTTYAYDPRGRLSSVIAGGGEGGQVSQYSYAPGGQLAGVVLPYGYQVNYTYDSAQRLTGWSDNRGASASYELDGMGNRTREEIRNDKGSQWVLARSVNTLNRLAKSTAGGYLVQSYSYDANGNLERVEYGNGERTLIGLDNLRRVRNISNGQGTSVLTLNALDELTSASDVKGVATTYTRDALGNATTETSPDTGTETAQYDALGLPKTITDALGQATTIERDLLGRPTLITHADGRTTTLRYDLTAASKGYLGEIVDPSGTTTYVRDTQGRVTTKTQRLINGDTRSVSYAYNAQGLLASTTYPGGQVLQNVYDTTGQLTGLTWAGQPLVTGITWNPLGQPTGWSWSLPGGTAAIPATRSYNTAGQLTATEFSGYQYDAAGRITGITQDLWQPASTNPQDSTLSQATKLWTVKYDLAGRIIQLGDTGRTTAYTYDANGNRKTSVQTTTVGTPGTISRTYGSASTHNRLLGFTQTATAGSNSASTSTSVTYQYNPAGDLLGDGLTTYRYDSEGRMESASTGEGEDAPTTKYAHNGLGQRVFKTEPLYSSTPASGSSNKNLNNLLADDDEPQAEPPGLIQQILSFFSKLWSPSTSDAEKLGYSYVYSEDGSLLGEYGSGGSNSSGTAQYIYLPTASGPMPIAAVIKGQTYAIHSDHLNTPRKLTQPDGQVAWQWAYSAFGDEQPTIGAKRFTSETTTPTTGATSIPEVTFNLRYPGQYFDKETKLHYNYFRTYAPSTGRYTQGDPIGLDGGWNRFGYVEGDPLGFSDEDGLQARSPRATTGQFSISGVSNAQALNLLTQIRRYDSGFRYETIRPSGSQGYTQTDVGVLTSLLRAYERNLSCPALPGSPYAPDSVARRVRPEYQSNPAHDLMSPLFNPRKTPEPADAASVYGNAVRGGMGTWYGQGQGGLYRYFSDGAGTVHFSGTMP